MSTCPNGGTESENFGINCLSCTRLAVSSEFSHARRWKTDFRIVSAGVMIGACVFNFLWGILGLWYSSDIFGRSDYYGVLRIGVSGMVGFFFSFLGGSAALDGKWFYLSLTSAIVALIAEIVDAGTYRLLAPELPIFAFAFFMAPPIILTLLGLVLLSFANSTFV
jgi:Na+-transporting NADH:ubiquinone oxidoreductase subunit NqrB